MDDNILHTSAYLELVELSNGDIILRRADDKSEHMMSLRFSSEVMEMLGEEFRMLIARRMVRAGIEAFNEMNNGGDRTIKAKGDIAAKSDEVDLVGKMDSGDEPEPTIH